ncbi:tetratricopeptide repeat protein [Mesonia aestuariivivens]|uniref:Tetratricopeptide repeat protein n=1 Tax=Mesonia aestuariivivens TaxID=2796128 RepID=A0ABS6VXE2_9FLAO|nr:SH3 domain-containing protein [Mesonia aestuariivivens]MBW2960256.1 tetratricopeptide repeat protein [Mesonia aestuariivivens]
MKKLLIVFLLLGTSLLAQDNEALFKQASQDYADGNYKKAIDQYEKILGNGEASANLYYNLGNAHYKLDHIAPSIYNYEKALLLKPNHQDAKNNLVFAQNMTLDAIDDLPKSSLSKVVNNIISKLSYNGWAWLAVSSSVLLLIFFFFYYFSATTGKKRVFFTVFVVSCIVMISSVIFAYLQFDIQQKKKFAIIFAEESTVLSEPNSSSSNVFTLHEGTKIKLLDEFNKYYKIALSDGREGWIRATDLKAL